MMNKIKFNWKSIDNPELKDFNLYIKKSNKNGRTFYKVESTGAYSKNSLVKFLERILPCIRKLMLWIREQRHHSHHYGTLKLNPNNITLEGSEDKGQKHIKIINAVKEKISQGLVPSKPGYIRKVYSKDQQVFQKHLKCAKKYLMREEIKFLEDLKKKSFFNLNYNFLATRSKLRKKPEDKLQYFIDKVKYYGVRNGANVKFKNENGIDSGGLTKQFFSDLFSGLVESGNAKTIQFEKTENEFYQPKSFKTNELGLEEWKTYLHMGVLMTFCHKLELPIGTLFENEQFQSIFAFDGAELSKPLKREHIENNLDRYLKLFPAEKQTTLRNKKSTLEYNDETFMNATGCEEHKIEEERKTLKKELVDEMFQALAPIHALAVGIHHSPFLEDGDWNAFQGNVDGFIDTLQGVISKEEILKNIKWAKDFPEEKKPWITKWINNASNSQLKQFLNTATALKSLIKGKMITFYETITEEFKFSTCHRDILIPKFLSNEDDFKMALEAVISGDAGFDMW